MTKPSDSTPGSLIDDVSDTALWVATYRAQETERPDALFRDPLASVLAGEKGRHIAKNMTATRYTQWSIVIRTCIIDSYIRELVAQGVDLVLNLGAGLDTRPYRMALPASLKWIEVDFDKIMDLKEARLKGEKPRVALERVRLDLSDLVARRKFFAEVATQGSKILVLTEGVTPYLDETQVAELARDLRAQPSFRFWVLDYFSPLVEPHLKSPKRTKQMKNAPFKFFPQDWYAFFGKEGWKERETRYHAVEARKLGREMPLPWIVRLWIKLMPVVKLEPFKKATGFVLLEPK